MRKNRLLRVLCAFIASGHLAYADLSSSSPSQRSALQTEFMKSRLDLDATTLKKVELINQRYAELSEPILKGDDGLLTKRSRMQALMANKDGELKGILSDSQFKRYDDSKDELKRYVEDRL